MPCKGSHDCKNFFLPNDCKNIINILRIYLLKRVVIIEIPAQQRVFAFVPLAQVVVLGHLFSSLAL
jgi:hypothetical protein